MVTRPDGQTLTVDYDAGGRVSTLTELRGQTSFTCHPTTGKLTGITAPDGGTLAYAYDGSLLTGVTWAGAVAGSVGWTYNTDFRVTTERVNGGTPITFTYDPDRLLTGAGALTLTRNPQNGLLTGTTVGNRAGSYTSSGPWQVVQSVRLPKACLATRASTPGAFPFTRWCGGVSSRSVRGVRFGVVAAVVQSWLGPPVVSWGCQPPCTCSDLGLSVPWIVGYTLPINTGA